MPHYRKRRSKDTDDDPPGQYVSYLLIGVMGLSIVGGTFGAFTFPGTIPKATVIGSSLTTVTLFAGVWAILKNLRQLNATVQELSEEDAEETQ